MTTTPPHPTQPTPPAHPTPATPHLAVRGEAHLEVDPELARITVTITARGTDRATTLADLTRRNTTAINLIKSYGDALHALETGTLTLTPQLTRHGRGEHIRTHHGTVHLTATLNDFTALGELTTRLADLELTRVDGPWWTLHPHSPAHDQAHRQAVDNALHRARAYAQALGTHLTALLELTDTDTPGHPGPYAGTSRMAFATEAAPDTPPPLDLEPQRQTITAHVHARFTLHPPTI
ncbi:SIMPL domain-containing protein [Streptomyces sp. NPDC047928]|uniref:SIMPL domain-containing protein n=1 Tax=unclassified Streptomyces TaxID=2593676 RepID=UPI00371AEB11